MWKFLKYNLTIDFIICFLLVVSSGNPIFIYSVYVRELYIILALIAIAYNIKKKADGGQKFLRYALAFVFVMLLQQVIVPGLSLNSQIFSLIRILIGVLIIRGLKETFTIQFVKVMTILAAISLILFPVTLYYGMLPAIQMTKVGYSMFIYNIIYSEYGGILARNSGMFWEPGAFQGYLNIAIAFALLMPKNKERIYSLCIMIAALLTTYSTTGYLVFGFIVIYYSYCFSKQSQLVRIFTTILVFVGCAYAFYSLDFMHNKIIENATDTGSAQGRFTDYIKYGSIIKDNFLLGVNTQEIDSYTGNGMVYMLLYYGGILTLYYFMTLLRNYRKLYSTQFIIYFIGVLILTLQGEGFMFFPLYLALPLAVMRFDKKLKYSPK